MKPLATASVAGAATIVLVWAADLAGVVVPPEVASAVTVLLSASAGVIHHRAAPQP